MSKPPSNFTLERKPSGLCIKKLPGRDFWPSVWGQPHDFPCFVNIAEDLVRDCGVHAAKASIAPHAVLLIAQPPEVIHKLLLKRYDRRTVTPVQRGCLPSGVDGPLAGRFLCLRQILEWRALPIHNQNRRFPKTGSSENAQSMAIVVRQIQNRSILKVSEDRINRYVLLRCFRPVGYAAHH